MNYSSPGAASRVAARNAVLECCGTGCSGSGLSLMPVALHKQRFTSRTHCAFTEEPQRISANQGSLGSQQLRGSGQLTLHVNRACLTAH